MTDATPPGFVADHTQPWYSQVWHAADDPLISANVDEQAHPFVHGLISTLEGFTSPIQLALLIGTMGEGNLVDAGADAAGKKIGAALLGDGADVADIAKFGTLAKKVLPATFTVSQVDALKNAWPELQDAYRHRDWNRLEEMLPGVTLGTAGALLGASHTLSGTPFDENPKVDTYQQMLGERSARLQNAELEIRKMRAAIDAVTKDPLRRAAISNYIDMGTDNDRLTAAEAAARQRGDVRLADEYAAARNLTPAEQGLAEQLTQYYGAKGLEGESAGLFSRREDYGANRLVSAMPNDEGAEQPAAQGRGSRLSQAFRFAKQRFFRDYAEGEQNGYTYNKDPAQQFEEYHRRFAQSLANREFIGNLTRARAADMRPLAAPTGLLQALGGEEPADVINPDYVVDPYISKTMTAALESSGKLGDLEDKGLAYKDGKDRYRWATDDYKSLDNPALRKWRMVGTDTGGSNAFMRGDLRLHPEIADKVNTLLDREPGFLGSNPWAKAFLKLSRAGKQTLLSLSPFHYITEALRHVQETGKLGEVFKPPETDASDPRLQLALKHGLFLHDPYGEASFAEGLGEHGGLVGKVPGVGPLWNHVSDYLFDKYIPALKASDAAQLVDRLQKAHPDWGDSQIGKVAADQANAAYGGLNYEMLGRSAKAQNWARALLLAPDFLESQLRYGALALSKPGDIARQNLARIAGLNFATAQLGNLMLHGRVRLDQPFGVVLPGDKGKPERVVTMRTMPSDFIRMISDPANFFYYRLNPYTLRTAMEAAGEGTQGRRSGVQQVKDFLTQMVPIPIQSVLGLGNAGTDSTENITRALGATAAINHTHAEQMALQLESQGMPKEMTPAERASAVVTNRLVDGLKSRSIGMPQLMQQIGSGNVTPAQARRAITESRMTRLQVSASRLSIPDVLKVWKAADSTERAQLRLVLERKLRSIRRENYDPAQLLKMIKDAQAALAQR